MKKIFLAIAVLISSQGFSQIFISKAMVEYEVKINNHKSIGEGTWADIIRDKLPKLSTSWYQLTFNADKSIYQFNRKDETTKFPWGSNNEDDVWYNDFTNNTYIEQKNVFGDNYILKDSMSNLKWKITNENREIAGFNCRKAVGILFDTVYVFAYYTDEITLSGGPMSLHGLPGLILGVTIPRMYSSWIATKVQVNGIDESKITPPKKGKQRKVGELQDILVERTKDWGSYGQMQVWNIFL